LRNDTLIALEKAVFAHFGGDTTARTTVIDRHSAPALAIIRADVLELLKLKAIAYDGFFGGGKEPDQDPFRTVGLDE